jgi:hypothetical protein
MSILKYPRTRHLEGSRLQVGDQSDDQPLAPLLNTPLVIEEKIDGANCALSFDPSGQLLLQSRGHFLNGGHRERHFDLLKTWASAHSARFHAVLGARYVLYGEWMFAKHTVFYDALPHYFMEFDVYDRDGQIFLSTPARRALLTGLPIMPVPVIYSGILGKVIQPASLVRPSLYKTPNWRVALEQAAQRSGNKAEFVEKQTENSDLAEGIYIKVEDENRVIDRFKFVRGDFLQAIESAEGHWQNRPTLPNGLREDVDLFAQVLGLPGAYDETR